MEKSSYVNPSKVSRFKKVEVFSDDTNLFYTLPSNLTIPVNSDDSYFSVTKKYENRIDLIAFKFYKNSKLWWVIAKANSIQNPMEVKQETILRIPSISSIYGTGGVVGNG